MSQSIPPSAAGPAQQYTLNPQPKTSGAAIGSLVCGILGCVPWITGLLAIVLGIVGLKSTKDPMVRGRGLAIAGLVLGCVSVLMWTVFGGGAIAAGVAFFRASAPAREQSRQFIQDMEKGNVDAALARCTSDVDAAALK